MSFHSLCSSELEFSWVSIFHLCAMVYGEWDFEHLHLNSRTKSAIHCVNLSDFIRFSGHECFHLSNSLVKLWSLRYLVVFSSQASESMCQKSGSQAWFKINEKAGSCGSCSVGVNIRGFLPELRLTPVLKSMCLRCISASADYLALIFEFIPWIFHSAFNEHLALVFLLEFFFPLPPMPTHLKKIIFPPGSGFSFRNLIGAHVRKGNCINWLLGGKALIKPCRHE